MEYMYRDINIALANEFAILAEEAGIDIWEAIALANDHPRVNILAPAPAWADTASQWTRGSSRSDELVTGSSIRPGRSMTPCRLMYYRRSR